MTTVAERVERQEQLDFLWQVGCDQSQGYVHSQPIPREEFVRLLQYGNGHLILPAEPADSDGSVTVSGQDRGVSVSSAQ